VVGFTSFYRYGFTVSSRGPEFAWTRRAVLALVVVVLSLSGHAAGSAMLPSTSGLLLAAVLTASLTVAIGTRVTTLRLFGFLLGVEVLLHLVFVLTSDCHPAGVGIESLVPSGLSMLGHLAASVVAVAVLRRGDQVLLSWSALVSAVIGAPVVTLPSIPGRPVLAAPVWAARAFGADAHLASQERRGPPSI
jgi:hypothetical protein